MPRTIEVQPGDRLTGSVMKFHLEYKTSLDGGMHRYDMVADVDCEGIAIEDVKELMAGQGLIVKSQNNRERKLADLSNHTHFKGGWKEFTKSSGRRLISTEPKDIIAMMSPEQKAELIRLINAEQKENGTSFGQATEEAMKKVVGDTE